MLGYTNGLPRPKGDPLSLPKLAHGWSRRIVAYTQRFIGSFHVGQNGRCVLPIRNARELIVTNVTIIISFDRRLIMDDGTSEIGAGSRGR